jgi:hypothetical protein
VYSIIVGEIIRDISTVRTYELNDVATVEGVVMVATVGTSVSGFFQDETGGISIFVGGASQELKDAFVVGNKIKLRGAIGFFNGQVQFVSVVSVEVISTGNAVTPVVVTDIADIANYEGQLVQITAFLKAAGGNRFTDLVDVSGEILAYFNTNGHQAVLDGQTAGTEVTIVGPVGRRFDDIRVIVFAQSYVTIGLPGSEAELGAVAAAHFVAPEGDNEVVADITLPLTGLFGSVVEWVSDTPAVIANDGTVVRPAAGAEDAVVVMTYELKIGTTVYKTGVVEYTVLAEEPVD